MVTGCAVLGEEEENDALSKGSEVGTLGWGGMGASPHFPPCLCLADPEGQGAGGMPGLLNQMTGAALPLTASDVTSFVSGYALGLTASLTYGNLEAQPFQGRGPSSILSSHPNRVAS